MTPRLYWACEFPWSAALWNQSNAWAKSEILCYAAPLGIHETECGLGVSVALVGGPGNPGESLRVVFGNALTGQVHHAELVLGLGVSALCLGARVAQACFNLL